MKTRSSYSYLLFALAALVLTSSSVHAKPVSFYLQAHEDDWQLFMSKNAMSDLGYAKVVFITLTAGDAGNGDGGDGSRPYYLARELGSVYSTKFAADCYSSPLPTPAAQTVIINEHQLTRYVYRDTVNYFFRLPDGNMEGQGFQKTGFVSLEKFEKGLVPSLTSVDKATTFTKWDDLAKTILDIIQQERGQEPTVWTNAASVDLAYNPDDHSDHYYTSHALRTAIKDQPWAGIAAFVDYHSSKLPDNLTATEIENASGIFAMCEWGKIESLYNTDFVESHKQWLPMDYYHIDRSPKPSK